MDEEHELDLPDKPDIADDDCVLDEMPDIYECRRLLRQWKAEGYWPTVYHVNERGNTDLMSVGYNGAKIVKSWV